MKHSRKKERSETLKKHQPGKHPKKAGQGRTPLGPRSDTTRVLWWCTLIKAWWRSTAKDIYSEAAQKVQVVNHPIKPGSGGTQKSHPVKDSRIAGHWSAPPGPRGDALLTCFKTVVGSPRKQQWNSYFYSHSEIPSQQLYNIPVILLERIIPSKLCESSWMHSNSSSPRCSWAIPHFSLVLLC